MIATVVRAEDAPGPTLVVQRAQLPVGALGLRGELTALRRALAGTPYARVGKIALYGPSARPGRDLDYRFVQAMPDGGFDFRTGCGHSLLACVVADGPPGPVTVHAVTTGDAIRCEPEPEPHPGPHPEPEPGVAHTLRFLRAPDAPGILPTGRPVDVIDKIPVSLVRYGNPYVLVDAAHVGLRTADELFRAGDVTLRRLLGLRAEAARRLGHPPHSALPKIAAFVADPADPADAAGRTAVRALTVGGWHPRLALTGAAALAAAAHLEGTVVPPLDGPLRTPGGPVTVSADRLGVAVHHKRATVLDRLELPWRIHATA
ncbi:PrpF domain-containing protein [Streptomyces sp. NPDC015346]|uniref:PrpF domain-containing protein n=1 Tax=Streptomyces sp. NPDC015346 TaxID=3364954 RepID=UPI0036F55B2F